MIVAVFMNVLNTFMQSIFKHVQLVGFTIVRMNVQTVRCM